ncbi:hydratase [uncultured Selenomonas sp.]|uniref:hydratase n=1 Tax=uncultured Selenomonas sp. TaxID=159275 RepID=UPI0028E96B77|nr:hydratase [uncultured Selenomonas sp.]
MITLYKQGAYLAADGQLLTEEEAVARGMTDKKEARKGSIAYRILEAHNTSGNMESLALKFDALASHDITFVGIIQTAMASGLKEFPLPYVLTNCHNSLCAVGGTINEDDHIFGLTAAKKFGGIFVPPHQAVIHQFMREMQAGCGRMILGSDSHTRYGAFGTMAIGEGGGELVKQLLRHTYDVKCPEVVAVYLENAPRPGVGPQDIALAIIGKVFGCGYVKNRVMEFIGPGVANLSMDFRSGIDVMTTETTCLSSIWRTDEKTKAFLVEHKRPEAYEELNPEAGAYYDGAVVVDLAAIRPMIAMPFHPSNVYTIDEVNANLSDILHEVEQTAKERFANKKLDLELQKKIINGRFHVDQGVIAGCAGGTFENVMNAAHILAGAALGDFPLSVYPASQPQFLALLKHHAIEELTVAGASIRTAFCGPCFGAGDVPANQGFSIRHTTRNFPNREGSKPNEGQISSVALMDARSIAATAKNGGFLTAAMESLETLPAYHFDDTVYKNRLYQGYGKGNASEALVSGPNIVPWPHIRRMPENLLLTVCAAIHDPVTTTDELIPSGETSSYRSNPLRLAEFTLSRKVPEYVARAKAVQEEETARQNWLETQTDQTAAQKGFPQDLRDVDFMKVTGLGSLVFAIKPGDGSAREQAASCQRVLGGDANIALEYATKRYRSNLINWGIIPFIVEAKDKDRLEVGDVLLIRGIREAVAFGAERIEAELRRGETREKITLLLANLSEPERRILLSGCLINFYGEENA